MKLHCRPYRGPDDLQKMKALVVAGRKASPHSGYPHVGHLDWWLYYNKFIDGDTFADVVFLWESGDDLLGWLIVYSSDGSDMAIHPTVRGTAVEAHIHDEAEPKMAAYMRQLEKPISVYAWADEAYRIAMLEQRGYACAGDDDMAYLIQPLDRPLPTPLLPEGFCFLDAMQPEWADRRAAVHVGAFATSKMSTAAYTQAMTAPGYDPALDVVVAAPDGSFASFAMAWIDPQTGIGVFEPVGTRAAMQRKGLGKAALLEGLRRMKACGMTLATVYTGADDPGNIAFYLSAGFTLTNRLRLFEKAF